MAEPDSFPRLDRSAFSVRGLHEEDDEKLYWAQKTPQERLEALELMRQILYGYDPATTRLQRVLTVTRMGRTISPLQGGSSPLPPFQTRPYPRTRPLLVGAPTDLHRLRRTLGAIQGWVPLWTFSNSARRRAISASAALRASMSRAICSSAAFLAARSRRLCSSRVNRRSPVRVSMTRSVLPSSSTPKRSPVVSESRRPWESGSIH